MRCRTLQSETPVGTTSAPWPTTVWVIKSPPWSICAGLFPMDPDNMEYLQALEMLENGGATYRRTAGNYRGFTTVGTPCTNLCLCYFLQLFCCRGRFFWCC